MASPKIEVRVPRLKTVKVTSADIRKGKQGDLEYCPIACALRRELKGIGEVVGISVSSKNPCASVEVPVVVNGVKVSTVNVEYEFSLGKRAGDFIAAFDDDRKSVKPATFRNTGDAPSVNAHLA